ncbi:MAG: hypothetical protein ABJ327_20530 [Litoreibacter sp.]
MIDRNNVEDDPVNELDDLFALARDVGRASMTETLVDRIAHDAVLARRAPVSVSFWERIEDALGGWKSLGGLVTAAIAGLYIGFADPTLLQQVGLAEAAVISEELLLGDDIFFDTLLSEDG